VQVNPTFDLFSDHFDADALWIEAVQEFGCAVERMKELAAQSPGPYFVFCTRTHKVLASIDTSRLQNPKVRVSA
jgi:hypothetical protein